MPQIRIKYFTDAIERLTYIDGKSDWIDLRASEEVTLKAGEFCLIPLGVAMELPEGYEAACGTEKLHFQKLRNHPDEQLRHYRWHLLRG